VKLRWTPLAIGHLDSVHEYIAKDNPAAADEQIERIFSALEGLKIHPQLGRKGRVSGTSELVIAGTPFIVAYRVKREWVEILAVLHAARQWPERL